MICPRAAPSAVRIDISRDLVDARAIGVVGALREIVGDEHHRLASGTIFLGGESAAQLGCLAEEREQFVADRRAGIAIRIGAVAHGQAADLHPCEGAERSRALLPVPQLEPRERGGADVVGLVGRVQDDDAIGSLVRQRLNQDAVSHAEHHRVQADANREAGNGEARNPLVLQGGTETEPDVLEEHETLYARNIVRVPVSNRVMLEARGRTTYYYSITGVRDVNFQIEQGAVLGLLGPNGSGKSTTVGMLTGLLEPSGGSVELDGTDVRSDMLRYKRRLGYVPEEAQPY